MTWIELVTTAAAALGAGLGVFNAWRAWLDDRVRLVVIAESAKGLVVPEPHLAITVRNLSRFAVTVQTIGFDLLGGDLHLQIREPLLVGGQRLPVRLEPRTSLTALVALSAVEDEHALQIACVYVTTQCGVRARSDAGVMAHIQVVRAARP